MKEWPKHPVIYEINTWVWLHELSGRLQRRVTLQNVPDEDWDAIAALKVDAVWLMGVWERSPAAARIARELPSLEAEYRRALPDCSPLDVVGSPYAIHRYVTDQHLGGPAGLAAARAALAQRGVRLILDFVPNHVAMDHPWARTHPELMICGRPEDLEHKPDYFFATGDRVLAHGKDPYFPPWTDTAQLNAFHPGLRRAAISLLESLAAQCDGVRCDMAMLVMNSVFESNWGYRAGARPVEDFWTEIVPTEPTLAPEIEQFSLSARQQSTTPSEITP